MQVDVRDAGLIPGLGRSPGEGHGINPMAGIFIRRAESTQREGGM